MALGNRPCDGEAKPHAISAVGIKCFEQIGTMALGNPRPTVLEANNQPLPIIPIGDRTHGQADGNRFFLYLMLLQSLKGVAQQIEEKSVRSEPGRPRP